MVRWVVWDILLRGGTPKQYTSYSPSDHVLTDSSHGELHSLWWVVLLHVPGDSVMSWIIPAYHLGSSTHCSGSCYGKGFRYDPQHLPTVLPIKNFTYDQANQTVVTQRQFIGAAASPFTSINSPPPPAQTATSSSSDSSHGVQPAGYFPNWSVSRSRSTGVQLPGYLR